MEQKKLIKLLLLSCAVFLGILLLANSSILTAPFVILSAVFSAESSPSAENVNAQDKGIHQNVESAVYWYEEAAKMGHAADQHSQSAELPEESADLSNKDAESQYRMGLRYERGRGVKRDWSQAVYWYAQAVKQGHVDAHYRLGFCYEYGKGVTKDRSKAVYWYTRAAELGSAKARCKLFSIKQFESLR